MRVEFIRGLKYLLQHENGAIRLTSWLVLPLLLPVALCECFFGRTDDAIEERWGGFFHLLDGYIVWGIVVVTSLVQLVLIFFISLHLVKGQLPISHLIGYAPIIYISIISLYNITFVEK